MVAPALPLCRCIHFSLRQLGEPAAAGSICGSSRERSAPRREGLMSERLITGYGAAARWERTWLPGLNRFICVHTNTHQCCLTFPHKRDPSASRVPGENQEELLFLSAGSAAWRAARRLSAFMWRGELSRVLCVLVFGLLSDASTSTSFPGREPASQPPVRLFSRRLLSKAALRLGLHPTIRSAGTQLST